MVKEGVRFQAAIREIFGGKKKGGTGADFSRNKFGFLTRRIPVVYATTRRFINTLAKPSQ